MFALSARNYISQGQIHGDQPEIEPLPISVHSLEPEFSDPIFSPEESGWSEALHDANTGTCVFYQKFDYKMNHQDAQSFCSGLRSDSHLAQIHNVGELNFLMELKNGQAAWLDGYKVNFNDTEDWTWDSPSSSEDRNVVINPKSFSPLEKFNDEYVDNCLILYGYDNKGMYDYPCYFYHNFICEVRYRDDNNGCQFPEEPIEVGPEHETTTQFVPVTEIGIEYESLDKNLTGQRIYSQWSDNTITGNRQYSIISSDSTRNNTQEATYYDAYRTCRLFGADLLSINDVVTPTFNLQHLSYVWLSKPSLEEINKVNITTIGKEYEFDCVVLKTDGNSTNYVWYQCDFQLPFVCVSDVETETTTAWMSSFSTSSNSTENVYYTGIVGNVTSPAIYNTNHRYPSLSYGWYHGYPYDTNSTVFQAENENYDIIDELYAGL